MPNISVPEEFRSEALEILYEYTGDDNSDFYPDQLEAIYRLVEKCERLMLVQRTGWGKSAVYFIATKLLRRRGAGPTLLISPLLSLMRDQIRGATAILTPQTINSQNKENWELIEQSIAEDGIDILLISPERLANRQFMEDVMPVVTRRVGLFVVDEAHCISNWGHDFRPDYQRIKNVTSTLPAVVPLLACTATANERVIEDVNSVISIDSTLRGPLEREGLKLHAYVMHEQAERLAWLAKNINEINGSGIIYVLTVRDSWKIADWLRHSGISASAYSAQLPDDERIRIENSLLNGELQVVVATTALGMGFDHPRLKFVIHYQSPQSVIHYYQQVGRAGRQLKDSYGILFKGNEDDDINGYFIENAFPTEEDTRAVLNFITESGSYVSRNDILASINISYGRLEKVLVHLEVDQAIERDGSTYRRTLNRWDFNGEIAAEITAMRIAELTEMHRYLETPECRNSFLLRALDDPYSIECGICQNCASEELDLNLTAEEIARGQAFLNKDFGVIPPRLHGIENDLRNKEGRYLSRWGVGYGNTVRENRDSGEYGQEILDASEELIREFWSPDPFPTWVTVVPSVRYPDVLENFASLLAERLSIKFINAINKTQERRPQREMLNSFQQKRNVQGCFAISQIETGSVLLIDDAVDSRWTMTQIGKQLLLEGVENVYPFALADTSGS